MEYTVHFQKGSRVGARSLHMVPVFAINELVAIETARREFKEHGYRLTRVDHFDDDGHIIIDWEG
jgi:hypothetical protein